MRSTAGVFGGYPINMATMPVNNDDTQNRFTGFAVANPSNENINVTLYVLDENGGITDVLSPPELNPLEPLKQTARFLHEYVPTKLRFKGSMVLVGQEGPSPSSHWSRLRASHRNPGDSVQSSPGSLT